jgi:hypothetical protein
LQHRVRWIPSHFTHRSSHARRRLAKNFGLITRRIDPAADKQLLFGDVTISGATPSIVRPRMPGASSANRSSRGLVTRDGAPADRTYLEQRPWLIRQTRTHVRANDSKVQHSHQQTPALGYTNSRESWQVAGIWLVTVAPLDQESPGSSPGGAMKPGNDLGRAGLRLSSVSALRSCVIGTTIILNGIPRSTPSRRRGDTNRNGSSHAR